MRKTALLGVLTIVFLVGCEAQKEEVKVQTVDWYLANDTERKATREECRNNPGELGQTPNCVNASLAEKRASTRTTIDLNNF